MTIKDAVDRIKSDLSEVGYTGERVKLVYKDRRPYLFFNLNRLPINNILVEKRMFESVVLAGDFENWWSEIYEYIKGECELC